MTTRSRLWIASLALAMTMGLGGCTNFKHPSLGSDPQYMSADTLCYRHAYASTNPAIDAEIRLRNLDCAEILDKY